MADVFELFDEYAAAHARGDRPRARDYLERAGPQRDELARLIDEYLKRSTSAEPSDEARAFAAAVVDGGTPLLELRVQRGLRRRQVVEALMDLLGLDAANQDKVAGYYHELESGLLEPSGVDRRVWDALGQTLKAKAEDLARWRPIAGGPAVAAAYLRRADSLAPLGGAPQEAEQSQFDEIDALFRSGG